MGWLTAPNSVSARTQMCHHAKWKNCKWFDQRTVPTLSTEDEYLEKQLIDYSRNRESKPITTVNQLARMLSPQ